ncbi:hypothetical protein [[Phormidium] sp. ETS-05]|uniref:hypothetical protein n=1 Tax=[Phormidium] sp. ETS-05 TaxID=222819 RepID=UPI0018EED51E|nr:hypothetical protein [[Phormidium] sp. ETS-05]
MMPCPYQNSYVQQQLQLLMCLGARRYSSLGLTKNINDAVPLPKFICATITIIDVFGGTALLISGFNEKY